MENNSILKEICQSFKTKEDIEKEEEKSKQFKLFIENELDKIKYRK